MLEDYGLKTGLMPIDGWRYFQSFEEELVRIPFDGCAGSGPALVCLIRDFRIANLIEPGNPELDVANYIRGVSPINDRFPGKQYSQTIPANSRKSLIERIKEWLMGISARRPTLLLQAEAIERANICSSCRQNVQWKTGCLPCCESIDS